MRSSQIFRSVNTGELPHSFKRQRTNYHPDLIEDSRLLKLKSRATTAFARHETQSQAVA